MCKTSLKPKLKLHCLCANFERFEVNDEKVILEILKAMTHGTQDDPTIIMQNFKRKAITCKDGLLHLIVRDDSIASAYAIHKKLMNDNIFQHDSLTVSLKTNTPKYRRVLKVIDDIKIKTVLNSPSSYAN